LSRLASLFSTRLIISLRTAIPQRLSTSHTSRVLTETTAPRPPSRCLCTCQSRQVLPNLPDLHTLILFAAFSMLAGVVPAASVCLFRRPNFFNNVCRSAAAHGFLPAKRRLFLSQDVKHGLDYRRQQAGLAAGLYVVLYGGLSSLITNESPQEASYKPRPPARGAARDA